MKLNKKHSIILATALSPFMLGDEVLATNNDVTITPGDKILGVISTGRVNVDSVTWAETVTSSELNITLPNSDINAGSYVDIKYERLREVGLKDSDVRIDGEVIGTMRLLSIEKPSDHKSDSERDGIDSMHTYNYRIIFNNNANKYKNRQVSITTNNTANWNGFYSITKRGVTHNIYVNGVKAASSSPHEIPATSLVDETALNHVQVDVSNPWITLSPDGHIQDVGGHYQLRNSSPRTIHSRVDKIEVGDTYTVNLDPNSPVKFDTDRSKWQGSLFYLFNQNFGTNYNKFGTTIPVGTVPQFEILNLTETELKIKVLNTIDGYYALMSNLQNNYKITSLNVEDFKRSYNWSVKLQAANGRVKKQENNYSPIRISGANIEATGIKPKLETPRKVKLKVNYVNEQYTSIRPSYYEDNIEVGNKYEIHTPNISGYKFKKVKDGLSLHGTLFKDETEITLIYSEQPQFTEESREEKGRLTIRYEDEEGNEIKTEVVKPEVTVNRIVERVYGDRREVHSTTPTNATYDIDNGNDKPSTIDKDNVRYTYSRVKDNTPLTGRLEVGNRVITLVYSKPATTVEEVKGKVVVKYVDETNREILTESETNEEVVRRDTYQPNITGRTKVGSEETNAQYDVSAKKHPHIDEQNVRYTFKEIRDSKQLTGKLVEGETEIVLVYAKTPTTNREVKGRVVVNYVDERGNVIKDKVTKDEEVVANIVEQPMADGSKTEVSNTPTNVRYDLENETDKPGHIDKENVRYTFKEVKDGVALADTLREGIKEITLVYSKTPLHVRGEKGSLVVHYVDENGNKIKEDLEIRDKEVVRITEQPTTNGAPILVSREETNVRYNIDNEIDKPSTIVHEGWTYRFSNVRNDSPLEGKYEVGSKEITLVYDSTKDEESVKRGQVIVRYENRKGERIKEDVVHTGETVVANVVTHTKANGESTKDEVPTNETYVNKPELKVERISKLGKVYINPVLKENSLPETGKINEGDNVITYVYDTEESTVTVRYVDKETGNEIEDSVTLTGDVNDGYDVTPNRKTTIEKNGKIYNIVDVTGNVTGTYTKESITVTYIYDTEKSGLNVYYRTTDGKEIKDPIKERNVEVGTDYNMEDTRNPEIVHEGRVYRYVRSEGDSLRGKIENDATNIVHVYEEVKHRVYVTIKDNKGKVLKERYEYIDVPLSSGERYHIVPDEMYTDEEYNEYAYVRSEGDSLNGEIENRDIEVVLVYKKAIAEETPKDPNGTDGERPEPPRPPKTDEPKNEPPVIPSEPDKPVKPEKPVPPVKPENPVPPVKPETPEKPIPPVTDEPFREIPREPKPEVPEVENPNKEVPPTKPDEKDPYEFINIDPKDPNPTTPKVEKPVEPKVDEPTEPKVEKPVEPKVEKPVEPKVEKPVEPKVEKPIEPKVDEPTSPKVDEPTEPKVDEPTEPKVEKPIEPKVDEPTSPEVDKPVEPKVDEPTEPKVDEPTSPKVEKPVEPKVDEPNKPTDEVILITKKIYIVDENGKRLGELPPIKGKIGKIYNVDPKVPNGYELIPGQKLTDLVLENDTPLEIVVKAKLIVKKIRLVDKETGKVFEVETYKVRIGDKINYEPKVPEGYELISGQKLTDILVENEETLDVYVREKGKKELPITSRAEGNTYMVASLIGLAGLALMTRRKKEKE